MKRVNFMKKNILIILTSHEDLGDTGEKTGFWLEELAAPYYVFVDAGVKVTLASPKGGKPPLDPKSNESLALNDSTRRFEQDQEAMTLLNNTKKLNEISLSDYDAIFYPGGHGPLWDLANDEISQLLIESAILNNKPVAVVCHAPAVLRHVTINGVHLVKDKKVTGFSNSEEEAVGLSKIVPFLVEDMLKENGGIYSRGLDWKSYVVSDGLLITGQNPASSAKTAQELLLAIK